MMSKYPEYSAYEIPDSWKSLPSRWGHSLHTICARAGSFPPRLVHFLISRFSNPGDRVLDLYSGKGTTVLESCLMGRRGIGNDICPDAYVLTLAKAQPPRKTSFLAYLGQVKKRMRRVSLSDLDNEHIRIYYSEKTLKEILAIRNIIKEDELRTVEENVGMHRTESLRMNVNFLKSLMLGILHGRASFALSLPMPHSFSMSPSYVKRKVAEDPKKFAKPNRDVIKCLIEKTRRVYKDPIPSNFWAGEAYQCDAKELKLDNPVDLVITSPPYLDVHTYAWDNWIRLWFLGYNYREVRKTLFQTQSEKLYIEEMHKSLINMNKLLKADSRCFVVVGDVKGHKPIANLLADMITSSKDIDFSVHRIIVDDIKRNTKYLYGNNSHRGINTDRILELHKGDPQHARARTTYGRFVGYEM